MVIEVIAGEVGEDSDLEMHAADAVGRARARSPPSRAASRQRRAGGEQRRAPAQHGGGSALGTARAAVQAGTQRADGAAARAAHVHACAMSCTVEVLPLVPVTPTVVIAWLGWSWKRSGHRPEAAQAGHRDRVWQRGESSLCRRLEQHGAGAAARLRGELQPMHAVAGDRDEGVAGCTARLSIVSPVISRSSAVRRVVGTSVRHRASCARLAGSGVATKSAATSGELHGR